MTIHLAEFRRVYELGWQEMRKMDARVEKDCELKKYRLKEK